MDLRFYFGLGALVVRVLKWVRGSFSLTPVIVYSGFTRMNVLVLQRILHNIWLSVGLLLMLLTGCSESEQAKKEKYLATLPSDHGKTVEVNGEKFRIAYIGGVRFRFPDDDKSEGVNKTPYIPASSGVEEGINFGAHWPDLPPGKVPGTKYIKWFDGKNYRSNSVEVIVRGQAEPAIVDKTKEPGEGTYRIPSGNYTVHDDLTLGLRVFTSNEFGSYAYSLSKDAVEPWGGLPIVVSDGYIFFHYAPKVWVRIKMSEGDGGAINPNWKGIYLGVVETLNKYREDKK